MDATMMFKTHLAIAILVSLLAFYYFSFQQPVLFGFLFLFSAILPDIDTAKSWIGRRTKPFSSFLGFVFGHRGFFHTLWAPLSLFVLFYFLKLPFVAGAVFAGYSLHLVCDAFTSEGVRLFAPLWGFNFRGFMKTGGIAEHLVLLAVCSSIGLFAIYASGMP